VSLLPKRYNDYRWPLPEDAVHSRDVVKEDTRRFRDCFIRLIVAMEFEGLHHSRAETVMKTFITWNKLGR